MEDEFVEFVSGKEVEMALKFFDGEEMAADVEIVGAPWESGMVENGAFGECDAAVGVLQNVGGKHLDEGLEGIEKSGFAVGTDLDAFGADKEEVAFVAEFGIDGVVETEVQAVVGGGADVGKTHVEPAEGVRNVFGGGSVAAQVFKAKTGRRGEGESATFQYKILGLRDNGVFSYLHFFAARREDEQQERQNGQEFYDDVFVVHDF